MVEYNTKLIETAVRELERGGMVAFPTETVYGLGADAANAEAIGRVYALKGRPADHPSIVHLDSLDKLECWAANIPQAAWRLAEHFWPGPMTLILPKQPQVLPQVTGGQDSVGLRIPAHPLTRRLIAEFGRGIIGPSANRFSHVSPTTAQHVRSDFGDSIPCILDGGPCQVGVESTIIDFSHPQPVIVRPGMLSASAISQLAGFPIKYGQGSRAPGTLKKHYSPHSPARLVTEAHLNEVLEGYPGQVVLLAQTLKVSTVERLRLLPMPQQAQAYAHELYGMLRYADSLNPTIILIEEPPQDEAWAAVHDRLKRSAAQ